MSNEIDPADLRTILVAIVGQVLDDYVKLQHPSARTKKYLQEHYLEAVDFLFDEEYELEHLTNGVNGQMSVDDLLSEVLDTEFPPMDKLQHYAITEAKRYWEDRSMAVLDHIPDTICISGKTFNIQHSYITGYVINVDDLTIQLDKENTKHNQENLFQAIIETIFLIADVPIKKTLIKLLSKELFWLLKVNNFFSYVGVASETEIFAKKQAAATT